MTSYRILLCDDALFMRTMLDGIVTDAGYEVVGEAENGNQALELYKSTRPDVVMMDMVMPELSGVDAVKAIVAFDPDARVLMCSAMGQQALIAAAMAAGARGFVTKPFTSLRVLEALADVMADKAP